MLRILVFPFHYYFGSFPNGNGMYLRCPPWAKWASALLTMEWKLLVIWSRKSMIIIIIIIMTMMRYTIWSWSTKFSQFYLFSSLVFSPPIPTKNGTGTSDAGGRGNGHPSDNPFYSNIDSMPDIRPRRKSIPLVSELVSANFIFNLLLNHQIIQNERAAKGISVRFSLISRLFSMHSTFIRKCQTKKGKTPHFYANT